MPGELLIDTNIVIASFKGQQSILNRLAAASSIYVTSVSVGELFYGALKSSNQTENLDRVQQWLTTAVVLSCDTDTARCYAGIKHELQQKGRPIPDNDLWIAAVAIQHDLLLLTRDHHFGEISQLAAEICGYSRPILEATWWGYAMIIARSKWMPCFSWSWSVFTVVILIAIVVQNAGQGVFQQGEELLLLTATNRGQTEPVSIGWPFAAVSTEIPLRPVCKS